MDGKEFYMPFENHDQAKEVIKDKETLAKIRKVITESGL